MTCSVDECRLFCYKVPQNSLLALKPQLINSKPISNHQQIYQAQDVIPAPDAVLLFGSTSVDPLNELCDFLGGQLAGMSASLLDLDELAVRRISWNDHGSITGALHRVGIGGQVQTGCRRSAMAHSAFRRQQRTNCGVPCQGRDNCSLSCGGRGFRPGGAQCCR